MINNEVNIALYKLQLHKDKGAKSELSIHEVAQLMDIVHFGATVKEVSKPSIFFQFSQN